MDEFDRRGELDVTLAAIVELARACERDQRPEPLAAGIDEVGCKLRDQRRLARHPGMYLGVDRGKIGADQRRQSLNRIDGGPRGDRLLKIRAHLKLVARLGYRHLWEVATWVKELAPLGPRNPPRQGNA